MTSIPTPDEDPSTEAPASGPTATPLPPDHERISRMPYESFLAERQRIVDARQRAQQRFDQIVSAGAAGALVFSITFIEKLAPTPDPTTRGILVGAWAALLVALGSNFLSHLFSQRAFDHYLREFDRAYCDAEPCNYNSSASTASRWLDGVSAVAFVAGVFLLASFSLTNLNFRGLDAANVEARASADSTSATSPAAAEAGTEEGAAATTTPR